MAYKMLIDGKLVDGARTLEVFNPATGRCPGSVPAGRRGAAERGGRGGEEGVPGLVGAVVRRAAKRLEAVADGLEARADEFARLLTQEQGKPLPQAQGEVGGAVVWACAPSRR